MTFGRNQLEMTMREAKFLKKKEKRKKKAVSLLHRRLRASVPVTSAAQEPLEAAAVIRPCEASVAAPS